MVNLLVWMQPLSESSRTQLSVVPPQVSDAVTCASTLAQVGWLATVGLQPRSLPDGQVVIVGGVVSTTLIICEQELLLPQASVAVQVRIVTDLIGQASPAVLSKSNVVEVPFTP